jgi:hypothetical protein
MKRNETLRKRIAKANADIAAAQDAIERGLMPLTSKALLAMRLAARERYLAELGAN